MPIFHIMEWGLPDVKDRALHKLLHAPPFIHRVRAP
jgi:hypothetical protein